MSRADQPKKTVLFAGNPNVGKSTLFNSLTGSRQHTGNWSGKTVAAASGRLRKHRDWELVDLPGMHSLHGSSEDERVAAQWICSEAGDCVVVVCDGTCLFRGLILTLQIMAYRDNVVLCVNMMDEAKKKGIHIRKELLEQQLGIPVVFTAGDEKHGLTELIGQIELACSRTGGGRRPVEDPIQQARSITDSCVEIRPAEDDRWRLLLDRLLVSPRKGFLILGLLLLLILWLTVWGANYPSALMQWGADRLYEALSVLKSILPLWLSGMLLDGVYTTAARVICVMLPPLLIFFPLFALLEDAGYLPRLAFLLERGMHRCGGCGKQALTLCMGLGCNAVGVTGCRIIASPRQRLAAILTNAMVPCNGRFPALICLGALYFGDSAGALAVAVCVVLGVWMAMASTWGMNKTVLKAYPTEAGFLMELPPLRRPRLRNILVRTLLDRTLCVAGRALTVAAPAGAILWLLTNGGCIPMLCGALEPMGAMLGMNGAILLSFLLSFPANELFLPVLVMTLGTSLGEAGLSLGTGICMMVFTLFHWPCATTLLTVHKETGSIRKTAAAAVLPTAVGVILCLMLKLLIP